jgi:hypothetical protein
LVAGFTISRREKVTMRSQVAIAKSEPSSTPALAALGEAEGGWRARLSLGLSILAPPTTHKAFSRETRASIIAF